MTINKDILLKQILSSTIKSLKLNWLNINLMYENYDKVIENINIYNNRYEKIFIQLENIKEKIVNGDELETITIIKGDNFISSVMVDYIIINLLLTIAEYFANNDYSTLNIVEYFTWLVEDITFSSKKLMIANVTDLYIRKNQEQELFLMKLFKILNKRIASRMYNILIINEELKDIINNNEWISASIKWTILFK